ncbi:MAG: hypothetical protein KGI29_07870 [Pseudomonadota bacterium]|nr:hypothetical protein [Pseudomonadota bacterium]MDE3036986.1 hypothetical protein [Pseudomonadota bacterium]
MGKNVINFDLTESDPDLKLGLTCDIEINNESGNTLQDILKSTAEALRTIAAQIEADELDSGHHPIKTPSGEKIGEIYLDRHATRQL